MKTYFLSFALFLVCYLCQAQLSQAEYYRLFETNNPQQYENYLKIHQASKPQPRYQEGYYRNDGTYVQPHYKTQPNQTNWDNYSTLGNTNPYTYEYGTKAPDYSLPAQSYGQGRTIYTGPNGGQYYINSNGNKTYVPKRRSGW